MSTKNSGTPLTLEMFEEALLPRIEEIVDEKVGKLSSEVKNYRGEIIEFKEAVIGEVKDLRDEVAVALHQYDRTNKRVDKIAQHLNFQV